MKNPLVLKILGWFGLVVSGTLVLPLAWALWDASADWLPILCSLAAGGVLSGLMIFVGTGLSAQKEQNINAGDAAVIVTGAWVLASALGALPYWLGGYCSYTDAFFEAMSGFTTTGASVFPLVEALPRGILFWRALTHWLGGMGIIVLGLTVLKLSGVGGMELYKAEAPTPLPEKLTPRLCQTALWLWLIYMGLTAAETAALVVCGMTPFHALCHAFSTMATGGFSTFNGSVGQLSSPAVEWVIIVFMVLAGVNFTLHFLALRGEVSCYWKDDECRLYGGILLAGGAFAAVLAMRAGFFTQWGEAFRRGLFTVVSTMTTTGFVVCNYDLWPAAAKFLLMLLICIGASAGSTGGGMKCARIIVLFRQCRRELRHSLAPYRVDVLHYGGGQLKDRDVSSIGTFFVAYVSCLGLLSLLAALLGCDATTALTSVITCLGNTGPGLGSVGPVGNYAALAGSVKWVLSFAMLLGRLEIITVALAFFSSFRRL
ncbi:TrkH family potassium uptake protein [Jonquetella anthropi]|uniref:TrkH family potassium uptake protein n=1 Tax=Jonquetella anthropi TaxID=428712 RepID=UPI0001B911E8|nr:TrkH family potassium uptake protein [Jonquetella anthropi]EEX48237.1 potassium uptake protein, TrkH family [Jonquetella anthropi E3_33 E1]